MKLRRSALVSTVSSGLLAAMVTLVVGAGCGDGTTDPLLDLAASTCDGDPAGCGGGCTSDSQCPASSPRCDKNVNRCVPCLPLRDNCPTGSRCVAQGVSYACISECHSAADCPRGDGGSIAECCNAMCLDTQRDRLNCGGCGKACPLLPNTEGACVGGVCGVGACSAGYSDCDKLVADGCETATGTDGKNCGTCGNVCPPAKNGSAMCAGGQCGALCNPGFLHCSMIPGDGCEVNWATDVKNCGACGNVCPVGVHGQVACVAGACAVTVCDAGYADCNKRPDDGCEVPTVSDQSNCGGCGISCDVPNAQATCSAGRCVISKCSAGYADCDALPGNGCEVKVDSDIKNCGACARMCGTPNGTPACMNSVCGIAGCNGGYADCNMMVGDGCETTISTDVANCGGCGKACPIPQNAAASCLNGTCAVGVCKFGYADCDKDPTNGCEADLLSVKSCGACGVVCANPPHATAGCKLGMCGTGMCDALWGDCNGVAGDGCERSLATDLANCGACNKACSPANANPGCLNGVCGIFSCKAGFGDCNNNVADGCEAATSSDAKNCGQCGNVCPNNTPFCVAGVCTANQCRGVAGGVILAAMGAPMYGFCWYLAAANGVTCDKVCAATGGSNQANNAINAYADDCNGGGAGQPATWFFQNANKCNWTGPTGAATGYKSLGHGYNGSQGVSTYYGKCTQAGNLVVNVGAFPGETNDRADRCTVCACSQ